MAKLTIGSATLQNPRWPGNSLKPGETTTLKVDAPQIKPSQFIEFRIRQNDDLIETVKGAPGSTSATWKVPNLPHNPRLTFDAVLKDKASPKTGFHAVLAKVTSAGAAVHGFRVQITGGDTAFVPGSSPPPATNAGEKIQITYSVTDPTGVAKKGRYEIWGERYPDDAPLYTENFTPAPGAHTWGTWDGKANSGKNSGQYISPEFSPYRVRIIIGVEQASVDDAFGAGISQVAAAEGTFEVVFQSVSIRLQAGITEAAAAANYTLAQVLGIEPPAPNGTYPAMGRLPTSTPAETCRIRIPMACHQRSTDLPALNQGGLALSGAYFSGAGQAKRVIDGGFYNRPEIPIEFEMRLRSRDAAKNAAPNFGVFSKKAVGPAKLEPFAEDVFLPTIHSAAGPSGTYWKKATFKIKKGTHNGLVNSGGAPVFEYWQARFEVTADGEQTFNLDTFDAADLTYHFAKGSNELTVFLNRTKLQLGANQADLDKIHADYIEVDAHTIKLRSNFTRAHDVLWVVRSASGAAAVPDWNVYPPGTNCHRWYGGVRGADPTNGLFKKTFSAPVGTEPIIGKTTGAPPVYPYAANNFINLTPDPGVANASRQERVEVSAILAAGNQQGLAGVLFSPSFIAGDSYAINAFVDAAPYERNLGWVEAKPAVQAKTGTLSVWRVMTIATSVRLPNLGTAGLAPTVGSTPEAAIGAAARPYIGDGVNMSVSGMNAMLSTAFNGWIVPLPPGPGAPAADVHKDVNLATYRAAYNGLALGPGQVPMPGNANVQNEFIPYDHYREFLPPGIPANRVNAATNAIATLPPGTPSATAMATVVAALAALPAGPDPALVRGVGSPVGALTAIPPSALAAGPPYRDWARGIGSANWGTLITALTPPITPQPKVMQVIRWPILQDFPIWDNAAPMHSDWLRTTGFSSGDAQSFFQTAVAAPTLFAHEMGHSVHLAHFLGGNVCFKHHNLLETTCMMSYAHITGFIIRPAVGAVGPVGVAANLDTGWPNTVPAVLAKNSVIAPGTPAGTPCILMPPPAVANPCAKCILKLRGWQEMNLPCAWNHPDLF